MTTVDQASFRTVLGHFASGVVLVTGMHGERPTGFTCQSFLSLSLDPPLVAIAPSKASTSWPRASSSGAICVNVLAEWQAPLALAFARSGVEKFHGITWTPTTGGAPRVDGALAWLDCTIKDVYEAGDHWLVTAQVNDLGCATGSPLLFYQSGFRAVAPKGP